MTVLPIFRKREVESLCMDAEIKLLVADIRSGLRVVDMPNNGKDLLGVLAIYLLFVGTANAVQVPIVPYADKAPSFD